MPIEQHAALEALGIAVGARVPVLLWGGPGTGKSSAVRDLARVMEWPCEVVIASIREPSDFAGLPVVVTDQVRDMRRPARQGAAPRSGVHFAPPRWAQQLARAGKGI